MVEATIEGIQIDFGVVVSSLIILLLGYLSVRIVSYILSHLSERFVNYRIKIKIFIPILSFLIYTFTIYIIFKSIIQLTSTQVLAFSGLIGAALGFGIKDLFANIVGGIVIIFENPYGIGDKIELGEYYGEVKNIGLRSTKIRTSDDSQIYIPNYLLFTESLSNSNSGSPEMLVVTNFYINHTSNIDKAKNIVEQAIITSKYVYISDDKPYNVFVEDNTHYINIKAKAYVNDLRNEYKFKSEITNRVLNKYSKEGIERPKIHMEEKPSN